MNNDKTQPNVTRRLENETPVPAFEQLQGLQMRAANTHSVKQSERSTFLQTMEPGQITGASDDDPSGIVTYSPVCAQFGYRPDESRDCPE